MAGTLTSAKAASTQVEAAYLAALDAENLLEPTDELATAALRDRPFPLQDPDELLGWCQGRDHPQEEPNPVRHRTCPA